MNPSFIKMMRFEYKSNYTMWTCSLVLAISIIALFLYTISNSSNPFSIGEIYFFIFSLITWLFTLYSYQESTNNQSMQMYHLISISRNVKFFSKQFITLLAFPLLLIVGTFLLMIIINLFNLGKQEVTLIPPEGKFSLMFLVWMLGQSVSTLLAIVFKKNKILYALLTYFVTKFVLGLVVLLLLFVFKSIGFMESFQINHDTSFWKIMVAIGIITLSALFYGISYHLFFRRQL